MMKKFVSGLALIVSMHLAATSMPEDFVDMNQALPEAIYDIRYHTDNNFVGKQVEGYQAPKCILQQQAAQALQKVAAAASEQGLKLKIFDCYRPQRSVAHFMRWAQNLSDTLTKADYYPNLPKDKLVGEYIAERSGHSRGATVDLTLVKQDSEGNWQELDMASPFDMFDPLSNTANPTISEAQAANRQLLKELMEGAGFSNYSMEWWHYSLVPQPYPDTYFDFPVK